MPPDPSRVRKQLANELALLRSRTGLTIRDFALQALGTRTHARVQRAERPTTALPPTRADVEAWLSFADADEDVEERVWDLYEQVENETMPYPELMESAADGHLQALAAEDEQAPVNLSYLDIMVPGLAQVAGYARALVPHLPTPPLSVEAHLADLLKRQEVLHEPGREFRWVLTPTAITWNPDPDTVSMAGQVDRLRQLNRLPTVSIRVLPDATGPLRPWTAFTIYDGLEDRQAQVVVERDLKRDRLTDPDDVAYFRGRFEGLWAAATPLDDAQ